MHISTMRLPAFLRSLLAAENPALTAHEELRQRVMALIDTVEELREDQEYVVEKVRSWSARMAAQRRHEVEKNLKAMETSPDDPEATGEAPEAVSEESGTAAAIAREKDRVRRAFRLRGLA